MSAWATVGSSRIRWKAERPSWPVATWSVSRQAVTWAATSDHVQPCEGGRRLQVQPSPIQPFLSATCNGSRIKAGPKSILKKPLYWGGQTWPQKLLSCALSCRWREFHVHQHLTAFKAETREKVHKVVTEANVSRLSNKLSTFSPPTLLYSQTPEYTR